MSESLLLSSRDQHDHVVRRELALKLDPGLILQGDLAIPPNALAVVIVPHTLRLPRDHHYNRAASDALIRRGLATLLLDCFTPAEKGSVRPAVGVTALASRLASATASLPEGTDLGVLPVGYLATTAQAGAVALLATGQARGTVGAVVVIGIPSGLDLVALADAAAPTLLIGNASSEDFARAASVQPFLALDPHRLDMIPGVHTLASGDPGPHKRAFKRAGDWFIGHLPALDP